MPSHTTTPVVPFPLTLVPTHPLSIRTQVFMSILSGKYAFPAGALVSSPLKDFLTVLLTVPPPLRPSAATALDHPFLAVRPNKSIFARRGSRQVSAIETTNLRERRHSMSPVVVTASPRPARTAGARRLRVVASLATSVARMAKLVHTRSEPAGLEKYVTDASSDAARATPLLSTQSDIAALVAAADAAAAVDGE